MGEGCTTWLEKGGLLCCGRGLCCSAGGRWTAREDEEIFSKLENSVPIFRGN